MNRFISTEAEAERVVKGYAGHWLKGFIKGEEW